MKRSTGLALAAPAGGFLLVLFPGACAVLCDCALLLLIVASACARTVPQEDAAA
jgi:hypothetical protein